MHTLHLVSHTHWDREWYRPFQLFRLRLVHMVDGLLELLDQDPEYKHFMLDGQTIVLEDYLHMRPQAEQKLRAHIQQGRMLIGPWHILPDMFLVSPEAHIRNLLAGDREARRFGPKMMVGYMPDSFGHIGQMPQILAGFGIHSACLWRGLDDQPTELWWQSPDGTRVLLLYIRDSYSNGASLVASDPVHFSQQIRQAAASLAPHSAASDLLIMFGTDHMEPPSATSSAIAAANQTLAPDCLLHSTLPAYLQALERDLSTKALQLPTVQGELRSSKRSHLLPGVLSARMWIKQYNHACENLLEKWAEPFSSFASLLAGEGAPQFALSAPEDILRQAWQLLMECHPHDSICGCSIDQVHDEMRPRFAQVEQLGEEITGQSLEIIAGQVETASLASQGLDARSAIVAFNSSSVSRTDLVTTEVALPAGVTSFELVDESGNIIPHQSASGQPSDLINVRVRREQLGSMLAMVNNGRAGNLAIQELNYERNVAEMRVEAIFADNDSPRLDVWEKALESFKQAIQDMSIESFHIHARLPDSAHITFVASAVPGLGWKTFFVRPSASVVTEVKLSSLMRLLAPLACSSAFQPLIARLAEPRPKPPYVIENEFFRIELNAQDLTLSLLDKRTGEITAGLNRFVDGADCGDEYNYSPPRADGLFSSPRLQDVTIVSGPVQQLMTVSLLLPVPASLAPDRRSRSAEMVDLPITAVISLAKGVERVDIHTRVQNRAVDHRLRVHFPIPVNDITSAEYDGSFEVVRRPTGLPAFDETWVEQPRPEAPQRAFTALSGKDGTWAIANRGLPEVEVLRTGGPDGSPQVALTLLRCVGWLSRDDFSTRKGHAGPFFQTPGAQMPGTWEFDYSIIPAAGQQSACWHAWSFDVPLRAAATGLHAGQLPSSGSMLEVDQPSFVITAVKRAEDRQGWIVRGCSYAGSETRVSLKPWHKFSKAALANLAEQITGEAEVDARGCVSFTAGPSQLVTLRFEQPEAGLIQ
jgi:alpha-mannosidase